MVQPTMNAPRMMTALIAVLYLQAAMATLVAVASMFGTTGFAHTIVDGRRLGAGFFAFAAMLVALVIPQIKGNYRLLIVPLAWTVFHLADSLFELVIQRDGAFLPPAIVEAAFLIAYVLLLRLLSR